MRRTAWILSAIFAVLLAGCGPREDHTQKIKAVADIEALFDIDLCAKAKVIKEDSNPFQAVNPLLTGGKEFILGFPDKNCVEDFYRVMESDRRARDVVEGKEYFRIVGSWGDPATLFTVDRLTDTSVILRIS